MGVAKSLELQLSGWKILTQERLFGIAEFDGTGLVDGARRKDTAGEQEQETEPSGIHALMITCLRNERDPKRASNALSTASPTLACASISHARSLSVTWSPLTKKPAPLTERRLRSRICQ